MLLDVNVNLVGPTIDAMLPFRDKFDIKNIESSNSLLLAVR
jgi:hypothetical protein